MRPSGVGEKRPRDTPAPLDFIPGLTLSKHPFEQRKGLFMKKLNGVINCKSLPPTEFEGYTIRERFKRMGWERLLSFDCDKIYRRVVIQWMASLSKSGDELTGIVDGKSYTITPRIIQDLLGVDTRTDLPYTRFKEVDFQAGTAENKIRWTEACKAVFGIEENAEKWTEALRGLGVEIYPEKDKQGYRKLRMTPLAKVLWVIAVSTFLPRQAPNFLFNCGPIHLREIHLLHALLTGDYLYSFAHLMIDEIWDMYEHQHRRYIPYGYYISEILCQLGAVSKDEYVEVVFPECRVISVGSFSMLKFSQSPTEFIIDDLDTKQRITFPKEGTRKAPPQPQPTNQFQNLFSKFQNLIDKQSYIFQKQYDEMEMMVTNIQKQVERQALEAERREQAREKIAEEREKLAEKRQRKLYDEMKTTMVTNMQKQMERQALEAERREQAREKLAEERQRKLYDNMKTTMVTNMQKQMESQALEAERREQAREKLAEKREKLIEERERHAQIRAHAIIWDIERQRYFYEMEQEQLRMVWNQLNGGNAIDEFQFPPMPRTSLHPPQEGSPYYDPTQGDEIPKAFQPLYQDIYGPRRKKPSFA